jgi:hypothetical protein
MESGSVFGGYDVDLHSGSWACASPEAEKLIEIGSVNHDIRYPPPPDFDMKWKDYDSHCVCDFDYFRTSNSLPISGV